MYFVDYFEPYYAPAVFNFPYVVLKKKKKDLLRFCSNIFLVFVLWRPQWTLVTMPCDRGCEKFGEMFSNPSMTIELNTSLHDNCFTNIVIFSRTITIHLRHPFLPSHMDIKHSQSVFKAFYYC